MNWPTIVQDLIGAGYTQTEIADEVGCSQSAISEWFKGSDREPRSSVGLKLKDFHEKMLKQRRRAEKGTACAT